MRKPRAFSVGRVRVAVVRGPKTGRWYWRATRNRGRETVWTGWATPAEAERAVAATVLDGPADTAHLTNADELLRAWLAHLEDHRPDLAEASMRSYRLTVRRLQGLGASGWLLSRMQRSLPSIAATMRRRWSPRTVRTDLERLGAAWTWARREGGVEGPLQLPDVKIPRQPRRVPTPGEVARVLDQVEIDWRRFGLRLMYATGARIGEVARMTWGQVDLEAGVLILDGKTGPRPFPLRGDLRELVARWASTRDPERPEVLGVTYNSARVGLDRALRQGCKAASVRHFSSHAFRRAAVDQLARSGVDVATAAALLGHSPEVMLEHYRQVTPADLVEAVDRVELGALPAGKVVAFRGRDDA
jgi:integrase/recombinase XerD